MNAQQLIGTARRLLMVGALSLAIPGLALANDCPNGDESGGCAKAQPDAVPALLGGALAATGAALAGGAGGALAAARRPRTSPSDFMGDQPMWEEQFDGTLRRYSDGREVPSPDYPDVKPSPAPSPPPDDDPSSR